MLEHLFVFAELHDSVLVLIIMVDQFENYLLFLSLVGVPFLQNFLDESKLRDQILVRLSVQIVKVDALTEFVQVDITTLIFI